MGDRNREHDDGDRHEHEKDRHRKRRSPRDSPTTAHEGERYQSRSSFVLPTRAFTARAGTIISTSSARGSPVERFLRRCSASRQRARGCRLVPRTTRSPVPSSRLASLGRPMPSVRRFARDDGSNDDNASPVPRISETPECQRPSPTLPIMNSEVLTGAWPEPRSAGARRCSCFRGSRALLCWSPER